MEFDNETLPSEEILNAIQLERELNGIIDIYALAYEALIPCRPSTETKPNAEFRQAIEQRCADSNNEEQLRQQFQSLQSELKSLKQQIETQRTEAEQRRERAEERIATLRHELQHVQRINNLELDLVTKWEENRFTQAEIVGAKEEKALQQVITFLQHKLNGEQRIICEVESFYGKQHEEYRQLLNKWQRKYATESAKYDALIRDKKKLIMDVEKSNERHKETYDEHVIFVKEYLELKAEEQRLIKLQIQRLESAVQIQAWWRGTMVRRGLGPYKKKSKKGKRGKAKGK